MSAPAFVSYASQDRGRVPKVLKALKSGGLFYDSSMVTIYASSVMVPANIRGALPKVIESANNVIALRTPQVAKAERINYEPGMATAFGKPITLVMRAAVPACIGDMQVVKL